MRAVATLVSGDSAGRRRSTIKSDDGDFNVTRRLHRLLGRKVTHRGLVGRRGSEGDVDALRRYPGK